MYLGLLFSFGFISLLFILSYLGNLKVNNVVEKKKVILRFLPFNIILVIFYFLFTSFQYIDLSNGAYWLQKNDLVRYKIMFDKAENIDLLPYMIMNQQEPLYSISAFLFRKLTSHFTFFLIVVYLFHLISIIKFIKVFSEKYTYELLIAYLSIYFTFFLQTFCMLRMGIAVSIALHVFCFLYKNNIRLASFLSLIASLFHFSAFFLFIIIIIYYFYNKKHVRLLLFVFISSILGLCFIGILPSLFIKILPRYSIYLTAAKGELAINTYLTNFIFILLCVFKEKKLLRNRKILISYITLLSSVYIIEMQYVLSIFYRMIFFTYPSLVIISCKLFELYKITKNNYLLSIFARVYIILFWLLKIYTFCNSLWYDVGLHIYKLFYFY